MKRQRAILISTGVIATSVAAYIYIRKSVKKNRRGEASKQIEDIYGGQTTESLEFIDVVKGIKSLTSGYKPSGWQPSEDANEIRRAMKGTVASEGVFFGVGTAEDLIKEKLMDKTKWQLKLIFEDYLSKFKSNLEDDLIDELDLKELVEVTNILSGAPSGSNFNGFNQYSVIHS